MLNRAESMQALVGIRKEVNITYKTLDETLLGTPLAVPNAEPATAQISYTVDATTHLPTMGANVAFQSVGMLCVAGLNLTASARTISYRILKNAASIDTGTKSCVESQYWTLRLCNASLAGLVAGDVIEVKLWCADATWLTWNYKYFACAPTRIKLFNDARKVALNVVYTDGGIYYPLPTLGNSPNQIAAIGASIYGVSPSTLGTAITYATNAIIGLQKEEATYGVFRAGLGDSGALVTIQCHATRQPYYNASFKVTKIAWNELFLQI
jgi:hypothetical protein